MTAAECKQIPVAVNRCPFDDQVAHNLTAFATMLDGDGMRNVRALIDFGGTLRQAKTVGTGVIVITLIGAAAKALWVGIKHFVSQG